MRTERLTKDNKEFFIQKKDKYVLKPTNLNEGIGVIIGIDTPQDVWEDHIHQHIKENYLVQEFITIQAKESTLYVDGDIITDMFYYDYCPHLFYKSGKLLGVGHTLVRYSKNKVVNVLRGGGIGYALQ